MNGTRAEALAVNNLGDIAGSDHNPFPAGVSWQFDTPGNEIDLGLFNPSDIDESGVMAGYEGSYRGAGTGFPAIAWFGAGNNLQVRKIGFLLRGNATAISQDGAWVAGWVDVAGKEEAFVWTDATGIILLGNLGGESSMTLGVNNAGQVIGWSDTADSRRPARHSSGRTIRCSIWTRWPTQAARFNCWRPTQSIMQATLSVSWKRRLREAVKSTRMCRFRTCREAKEPD